MRTFIILFIASVVVSCPLLAQALKFSVCELAKSAAEVKGVRVSDCETTTDACPFIRGFNKSIELDFTPTNYYCKLTSQTNQPLHKYRYILEQRVEQVKVKILGKLNALPKPFNVNPDNACGNYGFECPLEANKDYKFKMSLPILRTYPKLNVDVFVRLLNEKDELIACVEMPARIQEPLKPEASV